MAPPKKGTKQDIPAPIIVKKVTIVAAGHHGGAWKVAYADFVTAMMAFFLLMWLLGATTEKQRKGIADYFTPTMLKIRQGGAGSNGLLGGSSMVDADKMPHRAGQTGNRPMTIPRDATGGMKEGANQVKKASQVQARLQQQLNASEKLKKLSRVLKVTVTPDGIRIDLMDDADFSMFQLGTTVLTPDAVELLAAISHVLKTEEGDLTIRGHTDALQWRTNGLVNNWSLSAGRAESTRQQMMRDGLGEDRFRRIEGVADREPLIADNPQDSRNRRMSLLLANSVSAPVDSGSQKPAEGKEAPPAHEAKPGHH